MRQSGSGKEALSPSGRNLRWEDKSNVNRSVPRKDFTLLFGVLFVSLLIWFVFDVDHFFKVLLNLLQYCFFYGFSVWVFCLFVCFCVFFLPQGMWGLSSRTRDQACTPCIGKQSLLHWTTREVPSFWFLLREDI